MCIIIKQGIKLQSLHKAYILFFTCGVTQAVNIELTKGLGN